MQLPSQHGHEILASSTKQSFSSLVDAMKFAQRFSQVSSKVIEIEQQGRSRAEALEQLSRDIEHLVSNTKEVIGEDNATDLSKQILSFTSLAIEQAKKRVVEQSANQHKELLSSEESEKTKTFKTIEAFLESSPFQIHDRNITLRFTEGAYDAKCAYRCQENIQYEFTLDCKKSFDFKKEFKLSDYKGEIRIPVNLGKSWIKKQPVPGYERLDNFVLSSAESSEANLIANFIHPQKESAIKIIYSKRESRSSLMVEYNELNHKVVVTSEPSLNKSLNGDELSALMEQLWLSLQDLENYKSGLLSLTQSEQNIFQTNGYLDFFATSWKVIAPRVSTYLKRKDPELDEKFVRDKISTLGENGAPILSFLDLASI
jgi:hypothetical protein